jgi:hypothetical protein
MMLEDMLAYRSRTARIRPQPKTITADMFDLELDARRFFTRMALDIGALADGANRSAEAPPIARAVLEALLAKPAGKAPAWRRVYREVSFLAARYPLMAVPEDRRADVTLALGRIRQFLTENADIGDITRSMTHHGAGGAA